MGAVRGAGVWGGSSALLRRAAQMGARGGPRGTVTLFLPPTSFLCVQLLRLRKEGLA